MFSIPFPMNASEDKEDIKTKEYRSPNTIVERTVQQYNYNLDSDRIRNLNIQAGVWVPAGGFAGIFNPGLFVSLRYPMYPLVSELPHFLDVGISYSHAFKSRPFGVSAGTNSKGVERYNLVKGVSLIDVGLWYRYKKQMGPRTYWNSYFGIGWDMIITDSSFDSETAEYDDYYGDYYTSYSTNTLLIHAFFINAGMDIRRGAVGAFLELNNTFYNWASGPPQIDGGFSIRTGLNFKF